MKNRISTLDAWRAIAAVGVLYIHTWVATGKPTFVLAGLEANRFFNIWGNGVQLFFVISGFCFYMVMSKQEKITFKYTFDFLKKRWLRIAPAFYFVAVVASILAFDNFEDTFKKLTLNFVFLNNYFPGASISPIFWSLAVEFQFYVTLPFIFYLSPKFGIVKTALAISLIAILASMTHYYNTTNPSDDFWYQLPLNLPHFMWGLIIGKLNEQVNLQFQKNALLMVALGFFLAYVGKILMGDAMLNRYEKLVFVLKPIGSAIMSFGFSVMILYSLKSEAITKLTITKWLSRLGKISYSFYLWHFLCLDAALALADKFLFKAFWPVFLLSLLLLVPVAQVSYKIFESFYFKKQSSLHKKVEI